GPAIDQVTPPVRKTEEWLIATEWKFVCVADVEALRPVIRGNRPLVLTIEEVLRPVWAGVIVQLLVELEGGAERQTLGSALLDAHEARIALVPAHRILAVNVEAVILGKGAQGLIEREVV